MTLPFDEKKINDFIDEKKIELIVGGPLSDVMNSVSQRPKIPVIGISHAFDINLEFQKYNLRQNLSKCTAIIVDCNHLKDILENEYKYPKKIFVIPYGCDFKLFNTIPLSIPEKKISIVMNRNWTSNHNNMYILRNLKKLQENTTPFNCTIFGDGPLLNEGKEFALNNLDPGNIIFKGNQSTLNIADAMKSANIYISASKSDGTSVSLLEAMAAGMMCFVSDFPSNLEWIDDGINGFTFNLSDTDNLYIQILNYLDLDKEVELQMRTKARENVKEKGNWEINKEIFKDSVLETFLL
jgi:glycosyltransferase involved in cell wall biosynthesis